VTKPRIARACGRDSLLIPHFGQEGSPAPQAEGLTNPGIAKRLFLSERTVEAHVRHVLGELDMPESENDHRRVLAVLAHLGATQG
jgi:hypothetical protein